MAAALLPGGWVWFLQSLLRQPSKDTRDCCMARSVCDHAHWLLLLCKIVRRHGGLGLAILVPLIGINCVEDFFDSPKSESPTPTVDSISPNFATDDNLSYTLTIYGRGFIPSSVVYDRGVNILASTFINSHELQAQNSSNDSPDETYLEDTMTVVNPGVGGGTSNTIILPLVPGFFGVSAGEKHVCGGRTLNYPGLRGFTVAYCFGDVPVLGIESLPKAALPPAPIYGFISVSAGSGYTCGVLASTALAYCWGSNDSGQLGNGTTISSASPVLVGPFNSVSTGASHACGVKAVDSTAYCWGSNAAGELGDSTTTSRTVPVLVTGGHRFLTVSAGAHHTCGMTTTGGYCWGSNQYGQLGDGDTTGRDFPVPVLGSDSFFVVSAGVFHTCAIVNDNPQLTSTGNAYCWGSNSNGQLGVGSAVTASDVPVLVRGGIPFIADVRDPGSISAGGVHTCGIALIASGFVAYCWGGNSSGQLGDGTTNDSHVPVRVIGNLDLYTITASSTRFTCGLIAGANGDSTNSAIAGAEYCWGENSSGQLGNGTTASSSQPVLVK
jgi:alpha-tubulin suppressor-like RCC1 family protein